MEVASSLPNLPKFGSDCQGELINFWTTIQKPLHVKNLIERITAIRQKSEEEIRALCTEWRQYGWLDPLQFYILNRASFSGTIRMGGLSPGLTRFTQKQIDSLASYPQLLKSVDFCQRIYDEIFDWYGSYPLTFMFLDPPYIDINGLYASGNIDHEVLARKTAKLKCKWVMTINDCPAVYDLYRGQNIRPLEITYGMNNCSKEGKQKRATELLISNY